ncbi:hypothetical protein RchiOBHm_Chr2g0137981 [Rosa chinensis]|uniref:Uncharacterized protein n=1 Tax=Rosa chinensis TaxID=74649 RepID=A0A2P6RWR8_ROSCH|nr:hypothetical protein RchiOBHm_Chr2g0137981 [Rosa chinensis]
MILSGLLHWISGGQPDSISAPPGTLLSLVMKISCKCFYLVLKIQMSVLIIFIL